MPDTTELTGWVTRQFQSKTNVVYACSRSIKEGLQTGLSRPPSENPGTAGPVLGDFAHVIRGIATGANEFFFLTAERAVELNIPDRWLIPAVGRTRDVEGEFITSESMVSLRASGRPTMLLSLDATRWSDLPAPIRKHGKHGEQLGLDKRALGSQVETVVQNGGSDYPLRFCLLISAEEALVSSAIWLASFHLLDFSVCIRSGQIRIPLGSCGTSYANPRQSRISLWLGSLMGPARSKLSPAL